MNTMKFRLTGVPPGILMHNVRLANPLDPIVKEIKKITKKGAKKTDEDYEQLQWLEFQGGIYHSEALGPFVPARNLLATIREAAKLMRRGADVQRGVMVLEDAPLTYKGTRTVAGLYKAGFFLTDAVGAQGGKGSKTMRCRPFFREWSIEFQAVYNGEIIDSPEELASFVRTGGEITGMLDYRPRYGRYTTEVLE